MTGTRPTAWSVEEAKATATRALVQLDLAGRDLHLVRLGQNALFRVDGSDVLLRVARPGTDPQDVARVLRAAEDLRARGVAVGEPAAPPPGGGPLYLDDGVVAVWRHHDHRGSSSIDFSAFGRLLRTFHDSASVIAPGLPQWNALSVIRARLSAVTALGVPSSWIDDLSGRADALEESLMSHRPALGMGVIHGDAHTGNVLNTESGLIIVDLDNISTGPKDVDFAPTLVQHRRFGLPFERWTEFATGYGLDDATVFHNSPFVHLRELFMIAWLLQQFGRSEEVNDELRLRASSLGDDPGALTRWHAR